MKAVAKSNGSEIAQASEINRARSSIGAVRIFYFKGLVFCRGTGQWRQTSRCKSKGNLFKVTQEGLPTEERQ